MIPFLYGFYTFKVTPKKELPLPKGNLRQGKRTSNAIFYLLSPAVIMAWVIWSYISR